MSLHLDILDASRQAVLPLLRPLKERFYLAGGTALALQIGHRDSVDFDFFTSDQFDPEQLNQELKNLLVNHDLLITQAEPSTLSLTVDGSIHLSFLSYSYALMEPTIDTTDMRLASVTDIGCMKLSAIISRSTLKDYVDLYMILHDMTLTELLAAVARKFPNLDANVVLKALVYFDDIRDDPIAFQPGFTVDRPTLENFIQDRVREVVLPPSG